jgi:hypothetical protein
VKVGDKVRLIGIPPGVHDRNELQTRTLFEKCLGEAFTIAEMNTVEGLSFQLARLDVGHILGKAPHLETIWVEPQYLQLETSR